MVGGARQVIGRGGVEVAGGVDLRQDVLGIVRTVVARRVVVASLVLAVSFGPAVPFVLAVPFGPAMSLGGAGQVAGPRRCDAVALRQVGGALLALGPFG
ncbi:hypothetical protein, partial [Patulibacter sp.]|uniref:hypothetical protein n=1 Tax=Patulibacter sp. TaxID=1912859 RepID=UPI00271BB8ED